MTKDKQESEMPSGLNDNKKLMQKLGGETGLLGPLVKQLGKLTEDPVLKQILDAAPVDQTKKH